MPPRQESGMSGSRDSLASTTLIHNSVLLRRILSRLPKDVIVDLVLIWLDHPLCPIHEAVDDDDEFFMENESADDKKTIYESYRNDSNVTKRTVIDKILGKDWVKSPQRAED